MITMLPHCITRTSALAEALPAVAVICAVPFMTAVTRPLLSLIAALPGHHGASHRLAVLIQHRHDC